MVIREAVVGSHAHNLAIETSDTDRRGIFVASFDEMLGLGWPPKTKEPEPGVDVVYWELGHFARMCAKGDNTAVEFVFSPTVIEQTILSEQFIEDLKPPLVSRQLGRRYLGYAQGQFEAFRSKWQNSDQRWKPAMHAMRALYVAQGIFQGRGVTVSFANYLATRTKLLNIRKGHLTDADFGVAFALLLTKVEYAMEDSAPDLPELIDTAKIERLMLDLRRKIWEL